MRGSESDFALHLVNVLLCIFNHLYCLLPFFLEGALCLLDFLLLDLHPSIDLLVFRLEGTWRKLTTLKLLFDLLALFVLFILEHVFAEFDEL